MRTPIHCVPLALHTTSALLDGQRRESNCCLSGIRHLDFWILNNWRWALAHWEGVVWPGGLGVRWTTAGGENSRSDTLGNNPSPACHRTKTVLYFRSRDFVVKQLVVFLGSCDL
jgi:hypothetical protein